MFTRLDGGVRGIENQLSPPPELRLANDDGNVRDSTEISTSPDPRPEERLPGTIGGCALHRQGFAGKYCLLIKAQFHCHLRRQTADGQEPQGEPQTGFFMRPLYSRRTNVASRKRKASQKKSSKEKLQAQAPTSREIPAPKFHRLPMTHWCLRLEDSLELGAWNLVLSIGSLTSRDTGNLDVPEYLTDCDREFMSNEMPQPLMTPPKVSVCIPTYNSRGFARSD